MKIWDDITTTALMGTERSTIKPVVDDGDALSTALGGIDKGDPEGALLAAAGLISVYRRAGAKPAAWTATLPEAAKEDTAPECGPRAAHLLAIIFGDGEYRDLTSEALHLLLEADKRVPAMLLPDILDIGRQNTAIRDDVRRVIGQRGAWLAAQNPDWSYAASVAGVKSSAIDSETWSTALRDARVGMLKEVGRSDSAEARRLLQSTWAQESADDRAALLTARAEGLSPDDEEFLEAALDDRGAGVRATAAGLLAQLPQSAFVRRMIDRATPLLKVVYKFPAGHILDVAPPTDLDAAMARDGIDSDANSARGASRQPSAVDEGRRASWLRRIVAAIPPSHWESRFDRSPKDIVKLVDKSDWTEPIIRGLSAAASRHPSDEWTLALLHAMINRPVQQMAVGDLAKAIDALPAGKLEAVILSLVDQTPLGAPGLMRGLLGQYPGEWPVSLTRPLLGKIAKALADYGDQQTLGMVSKLVTDMVLKIPPSMADEVAAVIDGGPTETNPYWKRQMEQAIGKLRMRADLRETILETSQ